MESPSAIASTRELAVAVSIMLSVQLMMSMSVLAAPVLIELASDDLGVPVHAVGYYLSILFAFGTISALLCGTLIARFGPIRVIQGSLVMAAVGLCLAGTGSLWGGLLSCPFLGLAMGPTTPAASHLLGRLCPARHRGLIFSLNQAGVPIGQALAGAILPSLGLLLGWEFPMFCLALACLALTLAAQTRRRRFDLEAGGGSPLFSLRAIVGPMGTILRSSPLLRAAITSGCYAGMQACASAFLVAILTQRAGFDLVAAGAVLTVSQLSGAGGRIIWGIVADRTGRPGLTLSVVGLIMTLSAILVGTIERDWSLTPILLCAAILGATGIGWNGVFLAEVARLAPAGKVGAVTGATSMYTFAGVLVIPTLFSLIVGQTGSYQMGFLFAALMSAGGAILCLPGAFRPRSPG